MSQLEEKIDELAALQAEIEETGMRVLTEGFTLADAIRQGATVSEQEFGGFGNGARACGLTAAYLATKAYEKNMQGK